MKQHQKRIYLAPFLTRIDIPIEFLQQEGIFFIFDAMLEVAKLVSQLEEIQQQFIELHKQLEECRSQGNVSNQLKSNIQQMEEEKQHILTKIARFNREIEGISEKDRWIRASKALRAEQVKESEWNERKRDQWRHIEEAKVQVGRFQSKYQSLKSKFERLNPSNLVQVLSQEGQSLSHEKLQDVILSY